LHPKMIVKCYFLMNMITPIMTIIYEKLFRVLYSGIEIILL
jgi:hypothetical protein